MLAHCARIISVLGGSLSDSAGGVLLKITTDDSGLLGCLFFFTESIKFILFLFSNFGLLRLDFLNTFTQLLFLYRYNFILYSKVGGFLMWKVTNILIVILHSVSYIGRGD